MGANPFQKKVARVLERVGLGWHGVHRLAVLLESVEKDPGSNPNPGFWEEISPGIWGLKARGCCHWGSSIEIDEDRIEIRSCGGHMVAAFDRGGQILWLPDGRESSRAWGDSHDETERVDFAGRVARRLRRLMAAEAEVEEKE